MAEYYMHKTVIGDDRRYLNSNFLNSKYILTKFTQQ